MSIIGLTGPTGAGKSTLSEVAARLGFYVVNCDAVAKRVSNEPEIIKALQTAFGQEIAVDGALDRKELARRAFADKTKTALLNSILLPTILGRIKAEIAGKRNVLLDAPTLFESGANAMCDATIAVLADRQALKSRIIKRDSLTDADASVRLSAAKSDEFFKTRADVIIENNGTEEELKIKAEMLLSKYITEE